MGIHSSGGDDLAVNDYNLQVLRGNIVGHTMVSITGHNGAQSTTKNTLGPGMVSSYEIVQSAIHATPAVVIVGSTSAADNGSTATGMLTGLVIGLDSAGAIQTESVTLDGQTGVTTSNTFSAINGFRGQTFGSGNTSAGDIWIGTGSLTSGVPAVRMFSAEVDHNKGLTAYYAVPVGKTLYLRQFTLSISETGKAVEIATETSSDGDVWITEALFGAESGAPFQGTVKAVPGIAGGTYIRMHAVVSAGSTAHVTAILGCELVDN